MYSMKSIDGKESNTAKGVNIATEFNELKAALFNKKTQTQNEKNSSQKTQDQNIQNQQKIIAVF